MGQQYSNQADHPLDLVNVDWAADDSSDTCSQCAARFALFNRRHHCRSCGHLVCADCSPFTTFLPQLGLSADDAYRICVHCSSKSTKVSYMEMDVFNLISADPARHPAPSTPPLDRFEYACDMVQEARQADDFNPFLLRKCLAWFRSYATRVIRSAADRLVQLDGVSENQLRHKIHDAIRAREAVHPCCKYLDRTVYVELESRIAAAKLHLPDRSSKGVPALSLRLRSSMRQKCDGKSRKVRFDTDDHRSDPCSPQSRCSSSTPRRAPCDVPMEIY